MFLRAIRREKCEILDKTGLNFQIDNVVATV